MTSTAETAFDSPLLEPGSLLSRLVEVYGPPRDVAPWGPSLTIPNVLYTHALAQDLERAGLRSFSGQQAGRVAWIVPLNQHRFIQAERPDGESRSSARRPLEPAGLFSEPVQRAGGGRLNPERRGSSGPEGAEGGRCVTGRPWTREEDRQLLDLKEQGFITREIGFRLAPRLNRSPGAIRTPLQKLIRRGRRGEAATPEPAVERRSSEAGSEQPPAPTDLAQVTSRLEASLCLAEDPQHPPAFKVLVSQAIQLLQDQAPEAANKASEK